MKLNMSFKHMKSSEAIKHYTREKSERLAKYFKGKTGVTWNFSVEKMNHVAHVHLVGNMMDFFGEGSSDDLRGSIDMAVERIEKQIRKRKEIVKDHLHKHGHRTAASGKKALSRAKVAA
jgi:putative sigma-54 modulation protein